MKKKTDDDLQFEKRKFYIKDGIDLDKRVISMHDDIDVCNTREWMRALEEMICKDSKADITVKINSFGGSVYDGLALYDKMRDLPCKLTTIAEGAAMSMGLVLFLAGDVRKATENTTFMAHSVSSAAWGKSRELEIEIEETKRLNNLILDLLAERTTKTRKWWKKEIEAFDRFYNIGYAKELGIVNKD